jgi:hypothetical protein
MNCATEPSPSLRARFRNQKLPAMVTTTAALRTHRSWDIETTTTLTVLRDLARRTHALRAEAAEHKKGDPGHRPRLAPRPAHPARRRVRRRRPGRLVQPPQPTRLTRDAHPNRIRANPLRCCQP